MTKHLTIEEARVELAKQSKAWSPSKFRNKPTYVDGHRFASKLESRRYEALRDMEKRGEIHHLTLQSRYPLTVNDELICTYVSDFDYLDSDGRFITEDTKSPATARNPTFRLKAKLFEALYGREIRIVTKA
jgi:Protein of unknown function (DUF1064)